MLLAVPRARSPANLPLASRSVGVLPASAPMSRLSLGLPQSMPFAPSPYRDLRAGSPGRGTLGLLTSTDVPGNARDISMMSLDGRISIPMVHSPAAEMSARVSPDGRWLAYDSDESGQYDFSGAMMAVPISASGEFAPGAPSKLFDAGDFVGAGARASANTYDMGHDGRFLMLRRQQRPEQTINLTVNWFDELKRLDPAR